METKKIIQLLKAYADEKRIEMAKKSYPTKIKVLGVTVPNVKCVLKEVQTETKKSSVRDKIELAKKLVSSNVFEAQQLAYEYLDKNKKTLKEVTKEDLISLAQNLDNWVSVDCYAGLILGVVWREGIVTDNYVKTFLKSKDVFQRRVAIVATVALNQKARGGSGDAKRTLEICQLAVRDHEDMMTKAMSWALRELAKRDVEPVKQFIEDNKDALHKRVLREVNHKITKGTKN